ncbi:MAG: PspC domain-containing protein, partial [bacterium]|nr:PspC domain-containing protein [bacterium]
MADTTPTDSGTIPDPPAGEDTYSSDAAPAGGGVAAPELRHTLVRARQGRVIAGVAQGLAATWGTNPWLVRAGFVVTSALAGLGVVLYLLGWLLMPEEGEAESIAQRMVRRMNVQPTWVGFILLMAGALVLAGIAGISGGVLLAAGLLVGGYVLYRGDFTMPDPQPRPTATGIPPPAYVYQRATRPPKPPRPRSYLGRLTVGAMFVTLGVMGALDALDVTSPTSRHYAAAAVLVIGAGLLVGTIIGRSRGLIFLGLLLLPVLAVAAITDFRIGTTFDSVDLRLSSVAEIDAAYQLEAGHLHLDLTEVDFSGQTVAVDLDLGVGELIVEVPRNVTVRAAATTRLGSAEVLGIWSSGLGAEVTRT